MIGRRRKQAATPPPAAIRLVEGDGIAQPGVNCWRIERADRFRCVQDGDEYFGLVRTALLSARRTVFILGWDIYAGVDLCPRGADDGAPTKLGELLDFIARRTEDLEIYVLIWDYAALYMLERDPTSRMLNVHFSPSGAIERNSASSGDFGAITCSMWQNGRDLRNASATGACIAQ